MGPFVPLRSTFPDTQRVHNALQFSGLYRQMRESVRLSFAWLTRNDRQVTFKPW